jgi:ribosomal protein S17E
MTRAETCLTGLMNSVKEGTVKVATLKLLEKHTDQFLKLGEIYETNQQVETSVQVSFSQRLSERNAFLAFQVRLECFIHFCNIFTSGKYILFLFPE